MEYVRWSAFGKGRGVLKCGETLSRENIEMQEQICLGGDFLLFKLDQLLITSGLKSP